MTSTLWLIAAVVFFVIEMVTPGLFFFACLAVGALLAALTAWMGWSGLANWMVFLGSSTLLVLIIAPLARRYMRRMPTEPVGLGALQGQRARVVERLDPDQGTGQVRLENGALWRAVSDAHIPEATWVRVLDVTGTRLRVEPEPTSKES